MTFDQKRQTLTRWLIWKARGFSSDLTTTTSKTTTLSTKNLESEQWMSLEQLKKTLGDQKALGLFKHLPSRPCSITGSKEEHMMEYNYTSKIVEKAGVDTTSQELNMSMDVAEAALDALKEPVSHQKIGSTSIITCKILVFTHTYTCTHTHSLPPYTCTNIYVYMYIFIYMYTLYMYTNTCTCIHIHMHIHIYTHNTAFHLGPLPQLLVFLYGCVLYSVA